MVDNITFLVPFYNPTDSQIKNWENFNFLYSKVINIHFLFDGVDIDFCKNQSQKNIYHFGENKGKFKMIYNHIKSGKVKTSHFKIVEPDDYISIKLFDEFPELKDIEICIFKSVVTNDSIPFDQISITNYLKKSHSISQSSFGNAWTLFPTLPILKDKYYSGKRINFSDDQLFSYILLANGAKIKKVDSTGYIYTKRAGVTNNVVENLENILDTQMEIQKI